LEAVFAEEGYAGDASVSAVPGHPAHAVVVESGKALEAGDVTVPGFAAKEKNGEHGADVCPPFGVWSCPPRSKEVSESAERSASGRDPGVD
jgi:hypothetical protein